MNISAIELAINAKINSETPTVDLLLYARTLEKLRNNLVTVTTSGSLPDASTAQGELYWLSDTGELVYASIDFGTPVWRSMYQEEVLPIQPRLLYAWGNGSDGQLYTGTDNLSIPQQVSSSSTWSQISGRGSNSAGVKSTGELLVWGFSKDNPRLVEDTDWIAIQTGDFNLALRNDQSLWAWDNNVTFFGGHANEFGQLGDGTTTSRGSPGTTAGGGTDWLQISTGYSHAAAIKSSGTLWTWGRNVYGVLGDGTTADRSSPGTTAGGGTDWLQISTGYSHAAAIKSSGTLWTWGYNGYGPDAYGRLGDGTTTPRSSPGTTAGGGTDWSQVSAGYGHTAGIKTSGTLWTWGSNYNGRLGDGTTTSRNSPVTTAGGGTDWEFVSAGGSHNAAIKTDGTLWTWGNNVYGLLGDGNEGLEAARSSPGTTAAGGNNWTQIDARGGNHMLGLRTTN